VRYGANGLDRNGPDGVLREVQDFGRRRPGAGMLGGAGFAGCLTVVLLSFALVFGLANVMDAGWAALIVAVLWAIIAAALCATGRKRLKTVDPVPRRTVDTIKEDAQWLKTTRNA
jgi:Na+-driven multidrug efflux pump